MSIRIIHAGELLLTVGGGPSWGPSKWQKVAAISLDDDITIPNCLDDLYDFPEKAFWVAGAMLPNKGK